jgi:hypothetical protein
MVDGALCMNNCRLILAADAVLMRPQSLNVCVVNTVMIKQQSLKFHSRSTLINYHILGPRPGVLLMMLCEQSLATSFASIGAREKEEEIMN